MFVFVCPQCGRVYDYEDLMPDDPQKACSICGCASVHSGYNTSRWRNITMEEKMDAIERIWEGTHSQDDVSARANGANLNTEPEIESPFNQTMEIIKERAEKLGNGAVYTIYGSRGRKITIFPNKAVIKTDVTIGSIITQNATDGEKIIYYTDVIGVQYKECKLTLGYLQLETSSSSMNNRFSNFFNENTFTYTTENVSNEVMRQVTNYVNERVAVAKSSGSNIEHSVKQSSSIVDELKQLKELLDLGIVTEEEFNAKKKQLLGL